MRLSSLSAAVAVAFLGLNSAHAAQPGVATTSAVTAQAQRLGFDQVSFGPDGRQNTMIVNSTGTRSAAGLRAANVDQVIALLQGELGALVGLQAGSSAVLDQFNTMPEGSRYYRMTQTYQGVPVFGGKFTVQTDANGAVQAVFGAGVAIGNLDTTPRNKGVDTIRAATNAALQADGNFVSGRVQLTIEVQPHLVIYALDGHTPTLAWEATVQVNGGTEPFRSRIFADASSGALLNNVTLITHAINRRIYDVANGCVTDNDPPTFPSGTTLKLSEGGSTSGQIQQVVDAYYMLGHVYYYFRNNFGRDSYDNQGGALSGYVRSKFRSEGCSAGQNAFWADNKMVIGAGGSILKELTLAKDVTYHEIGHGITEYTSGLIYQKEPGGLNEASSDIWGAAIQAWTNTFTGDPTANTPIAYQPDAASWTIGDGLYVSNGNPLRWMNDPLKDGDSADEYSDYVSRWGNCSPTANNDYCGVHKSSGIANLAFYLMSQGGTHPRGATTINVTPIGIAKAAKYVYEAHASASLPDDATFSKFRDALQARARANSANGGLCDEVRIAQAWAAVEVTGLAPQDPNACGGGGGNIPPAANFTSTTSGLTATFTDTSTDSDGSIASRSWNFGDGTTSTATNPSKTYAAAGTYTVTLTVTDNAGATNTKTGSVTLTSGGSGGTVLTNGVAVTGLSAAKDATLAYTLVVPAGATGLKFETTGGSGDADLYVKFGSAPTTTSFDCKSDGSTATETCSIATAQAGTYHVLIKAFSAISGVSLKGSYATGGGSGGTFSNTTDVNIPDRSSATSTISVSGQSGNASATTSVTVKIVHGYRGDLQIDLIAPNGTSTRLKSASTSDSAANVNATYTVNASASPKNGNWQLKVTDLYTGDTGRIDEWSITP